ncbi:MAG: ABC transporter permease [Lachnospiraceae bacterium]|jgi:ABC-type Na+ efflux pump permease subunit|nr:ABC transporter permease [Lachnospiraceae bacterium]
MRKFIIVLRYELKEYFTNKVFMILTAMLAVLGVILLFLPRFMDMSDFTGVQIAGDNSGQEETEEGEKDTFIYLDKAGVVHKEILEGMFSDVIWQEAGDETEVAAAVEAREAAAGFVVTGVSEYEYYVFNKSMTDRNTAVFDQAMKLFYRMDYCSRTGWDLEEITAMYDVPVTVTETVLNKDSESNYWYCYFLVIVVFMLIVYYGQMIAVSVTNEKSNRAIEVLVTSTSSDSLLFGKVIAGAIGGVFQMGVVLGAILLAYQANREQWGGMLDMFLHIPAEVILAFTFFGLGGYLFYAFLYGAMGALVSKTEDVSKSVSGLMVVIMAVYFFSLINLMDVDGKIIRILSFLPVSSYSTMFARIAMGTVAPWEILASFLILAASIAGTGLLGAKIYRMGTLRYGNPIKIGAALKDLKKSE